MGNRTAKFVSALVGSIIAGAPLAAVSQNAPNASSATNAAADCLASPKGTAPQGQHWHYRVERGTKRQCWYLRAEGSKATQTAQAATDTPSAESAAPQSVQNAHAEYLAPQSSAAPGATASAPAAASAPGADNAQQPSVAARWPDASAATDAPAPQASPDPAVTVTPAAQPGAKPAKPAASIALAAADSTADKPTGSLQMLLLVIGGALALAGLLASVIYRFAGGRARVQAGEHRRVNWDNFEPNELDDSRAPWRDATPAVTKRAPRPRPVDFDAARPQASRPQAPQIAAFSNEIGRIAAQPRPTHNEVTDLEVTDLEIADIEVADLDEANIFNGEFAIEAPAPKLATGEPDDEKPAGHDEDTRQDDAVDIDIITAMLERLAKDGPRLTPPSLEADLAGLARSQRGQSAARA